ncbi:MAG: hypothetical protein K8S55_10240 [Phycisphaerae bacterium]|nr:hypothetical protein [Phycisphaerae bacterium]
MKPLTKIIKKISSQPSWLLRNKEIELAITQTGGQMAPVTFYRNTAKAIQPYYVNPWHGENLKIADPVLRPLRGDFFCMPFGANAKPCRGEQHYCHGEPAAAKWKFVAMEKSDGVTSLTLAMDTKVRPGKVSKTLSLADGQNVVYSRQVLEGYSGKMPLGHHATLAMGPKEGSLRIATSAFELGMTCPTVVGDPAGKAYQSLAMGKKFRDLQAIPTLWKDNPQADCTAMPAREGFTDLLVVFKSPAVAPAWTTATNQDEGFLWFSLKDPRVLPATAMWISNRGRHHPPWNGRNRCLGLEDVCGYFAEGLADSVRPNQINRAGFPTAITLSPKRPTVINYIQGVLKVPRGFKTVEAVEFSPGQATFISPTGKKVTAAVNHEFLQDA